MNADGRSRWTVSSTRFVFGADSTSPGMGPETPVFVPLLAPFRLVVAPAYLTRQSIQPRDPRLLSIP